MAIDWKDALGALREQLPEGEASPNETHGDAEKKEAKKETLHVVMERKGRKGKTATIIEGFLCDDETLEETARTLKQKIGTGGSARGGEILLQGDWKEKASSLLRDMGYKVK